MPYFNANHFCVCVLFCQAATTPVAVLQLSAVKYSIIIIIIIIIDSSSYGSISIAEYGYGTPEMSWNKGGVCAQESSSFMVQNSQCTCQSVRGYATKRYL